MMRKTILLVVPSLLVLLFCCPASATDLVVSAAASLTNAFSDIGKDFEKSKPGTKVLFNFAASGQLLQQLSRGAPVDVFASADQQTMDKAQMQNLIVRGTRQNFVRNKLVVAVPANSKIGVNSLENLDSPEVKHIALANPESVPVGSYSRQALQAAGMWDRLKDKYVTTTNARQSLDYTAREEVEAGFVYITDALIMPNRVKVAFEVPLSTDILYSVAVVKGNGKEHRAREFVAYLQGDVAQKILQKYGFGKP